MASKDYHPPDHISFDTSHSPPNNKAFDSWVTMFNPANPSETKQTQLWPVHCVQGTPSAEIIPEVDLSKIDIIVEKGRDPRVEMYSAFSDAFGNKSDAANLDLAQFLKARGITHVYVVGLTGDCCVKCTALDAKKEGFEVYVVEDGTKSVDDGSKGWEAAKAELKSAGVEVVSLKSPQVERISRSRQLSEEIESS